MDLGSLKTLWRTPLLHIVLPTVSTVSLCFIAVYFWLLPAYKLQLQHLKEQTSAELTTTVAELISDYHRRSMSGEITVEEAQLRATERIRSLRYGPQSKDYFWLMNTQALMLMHPYRRDLEGKNMLDYQDSRGKHIFREFIKAAENPSGGYVSYEWQWKDDPARVVPKISYVRQFRPWGWIVGTGIYLHDVELEISSITRKLYLIFGFISAIVALLLAYLIVETTKLNRERERSLADLDKLRQLLKSTVDSMPSILIGVNEQALVTYWNLGAEQATGIPPDKAQGKPIEEALPIISSHAESIRGALDKGVLYLDEKLTTETNHETTIYRLTIYPLLAEKKAGAVIRLDDVTQRVRMDELLIRSEKMISLAGLAAGVAHEINNPLSAVLQSSQLVYDRLTKDTPANCQAAEELGIEVHQILAYAKARKLDHLLLETRRAGERASRIVKNLLAFSRNASETRELVDIHEVLERSIELVSHEYDANSNFDFRRIRILRDFDPTIPLIPGAAIQLQQVFMNILSNGAHAMLHENGQQNCSQFLIRTRGEEERILVEIADNGPGMDEQIRSRVFEPFFTTKPTGSGTGLGLYVSYFLVTEHHRGQIEVLSYPGQGAKFLVSLPSAEMMN